MVIRFPIVVVKSDWVVWLLYWKGWDLVSVSCAPLCFVLIKKAGWMFPASGDAVSIASVIKACA